mmetsp:Transcript_94948/g.188048  ORF Transcript_94948/g.188048 Transcript_94948/m.188048 type:complete len:99 (-) Transcript_94948:1968-2264(-)
MVLLRATYRPLGLGSSSMAYNMCKEWFGNCSAKQKLIFLLMVANVALRIKTCVDIMLPILYFDRASFTHPRQQKTFAQRKRVKDLLNGYIPILFLIRV